MSLLDENFDIRLEDIIASGIRNQRFHDYCYDVKRYFCEINDENINSDLVVETIIPNETGEYYVGVDYLKINNNIKIKIKLFDPKYVVPQPHRTIIMNMNIHRVDDRMSWSSNTEPVYISECSRGKIGNYIILGPSMFNDNRTGWARYDVEQIINDISTPISIDEYFRH